MTRSFDRDVFTKVKESEETEKYYRIGKAIAEAMKDAKIFPDVEPLVIQKDFPKNDIDPGIYEADLGPTFTGDNLPDLGTTVCHTGGISSVTYDKTSDVINIRDMDQSNH